MSVDFPKCKKCNECLNSQYFPCCFCCEDMEPCLCYYCVSDHNCVDTEHKKFMCDCSFKNATDEDIKLGADNYYIENVSKIIINVKGIRKRYFNKEQINKRLQVKINDCNKEIANLQKKYEKEIH